MTYYVITAHRGNQNVDRPDVKLPHYFLTSTVRSVVASTDVNRDVLILNARIQQGQAGNKKNTNSHMRINNDYSNSRATDQNNINEDIKKQDAVNVDSLPGKQNSWLYNF